MITTEFEKNRIVYLREQNGLSQYEFAKKIGTTRQRVHQWEEGICKPNVDALTKICDVFNTSPAYFFVQQNVSVHN